MGRSCSGTLNSLVAEVAQVGVKQLLVLTPSNRPGDHFQCEALARHKTTGQGFTLKASLSQTSSLHFHFHFNNLSSNKSGERKSERQKSDTSDRRWRYKSDKRKPRHVHY